MYNETTRLVKVVMPVDTEEDIQQGETNPILASVNPTRAAGDSGAIMLSETAENLFIAYEVVAMVKDESTGKTHFSQLKWKKLGTVEDEDDGDEDDGDAKSVADPNGDGDGEAIVVKGAMRDDAEETEDEPLYYQFMFESGDLFVAAAADERPVLDGDELQMLSDSSSGGLPDYSQASDGDVLGISSGAPAWVTPSGGGVLVVHAVNDTLDKTWQELRDYMTLGCAVLVDEWSAYGIDAVRIDILAGKYIVSAGESGTFACTTPDGYPEYQQLS